MGRIREPEHLQDEMLERRGLKDDDRRVVAGVPDRVPRRRVSVEVHDPEVAGAIVRDGTG
jgi:hypothetical protein